MKTKSFFLALCALLAGSVAFAQMEFKVMVSKGANKHLPAGAAESNLFVGKQIMKNDKVTVAPGGYLGLAHKNGKVLELKSAGTFEITKLSAQVAANNTSVSQKYVNYLAGEMNKSGTENMAANRYKYASVTGSVERDVVGSNKIVMMIPASTEAAGLISVSWNSPAPEGSTYVVEVWDLFDSEKFQTTETTQKSAQIDLSKVPFGRKDKDQNVLEQVKCVVYVKDKKDIAGDAAITYLGAAKEAQINTQVADMKKELTEENALNKFVMASFYEQNKMYLNALENYQAAMKMEPEVEDYKIAYGEFLVRTKLATDPAAADKKQAGTNPELEKKKVNNNNTSNSATPGNSNAASKKNKTKKSK